MDRTDSMSRFALPAELNRKALCEECGDDIYEGDFVVILDGDILCSTTCALDFVGAETTIL